MKRVVLLDLDECLGSFGAVSAFFQLIVDEKNNPKQPFNIKEIKIISNHLIKHCLRPGIKTFLNLLYRNRDTLDVVLFTNHENPDFLPFLQHCLNYLITGSVRIKRGRRITLFSGWVTRNDPRRKTTPNKNIEEILQLLPHKGPFKTIMFDDTVSKIISDESRDVVVEVPAYDWDPPYECFKETWNLIFPTKHLMSEKDLIKMDEDYEYMQDSLPNAKKSNEMKQEVSEFFIKSFLNWFLSDDSQSDDSQSDDDDTSD